MIIDPHPAVVGPAAIVKKLVEDNRAPNMTHEVVSVHTLPQADGTIVVMVRGVINAPQWHDPESFAELFVLVKDGGSYYVGHDISMEF
ncbi:ketosteroid isomerase family protein [Nonomuraea angiospora]|uniref:ketosteroid isomerase family protein n=1 Tax=Nonomuraea angiospora TaxID=46172 RepID=UPI00344E22E9